LIRDRASPVGHRSEPRGADHRADAQLVVQIESDARLSASTRRPYPGRLRRIDYNKPARVAAAGCDVLVGTPGRLIDYLKQHIWSTRRVEVSSSTRPAAFAWVHAELRFILPPPAAAGTAPVVPVLRHPLLPRARADVGVHDNPRADHDHAPAKDGRAVEQTLYHVGREEKFRCSWA